MKKLILVPSLLLTALFANAQVHILTPNNTKQGDSIDAVNYSIGYEQMFHKTADVKKGKLFQEQMKLDIGTKTAHFYSYVAFQCDSTAAAEMAKGNFRSTYTAQVKQEMYTDYPATGQYTMTDKIGMDMYMMQEEMPTIDWELCADSVSTILGYTCHMAKATVLGREWSAWYAEDIPLDNGPWLLRGLPGLILRAYTADSLFRFEANGIEKVDGRKPLYYKGELCEKLSRKSLASLYERYYADPIGFITNAPNVKVTVKDEKGNAINGPKNIEYILLDKTLEKK